VKVGMLTLYFIQSDFHQVASHRLDRIKLGLTVLNCLAQYLRSNLQSFMNIYLFSYQLMMLYLSVKTF
jgi:hypothetical protein